MKDIHLFPHSERTILTSAHKIFHGLQPHIFCIKPQKVTNKGLPGSGSFEFGSVLCRICSNDVHVKC